MSAEERVLPYRLDNVRPDLGGAEPYWTSSGLADLASYAMGISTTDTDKNWFRSPLNRRMRGELRKLLVDARYYRSSRADVNEWHTKAKNNLKLMDEFDQAFCEGATMHTVDMGDGARVAAQCVQVKVEGRYDPKKSKMLVLPGMEADGLSVHSLLRALAMAGHEVFAFAYPGSYSSVTNPEFVSLAQRIHEQNKTGKPDFSLYSRYLMGLLSQFPELDKFGIVGYSTGVPWAMDTVTGNPDLKDRITSLVAVGGACSVAQTPESLSGAASAEMLEMVSSNRALYNVDFLLGKDWALDGILKALGSTFGAVLSAAEDWMLNKSSPLGVRVKAGLMRLRSYYQSGLWRNDNFARREKLCKITIENDARKTDKWPEIINVMPNRVVFVSGLKDNITRSSELASELKTNKRVKVVEVPLSHSGLLIHADQVVREIEPLLDGLG